MGKTRDDIRQALTLGIGCLNVESTADLDVLDAVALELGMRAPVSIRVNPNADPKTHPYMSASLKGNKFGIAHEDVLATYRHATGCSGLRVVRIDCHIGSQITETESYLDAMDRVLDLVQAISGDWLGRDRPLAVQPGDRLAVLSSGAYGMSMASNDNTGGRAAEILVQGDQAVLIRARAIVADQMRLKILLPQAWVSPAIRHAREGETRGTSDGGAALARLSGAGADSC